MIVNYCQPVHSISLVRWPNHFLLEKVNEPKMFWIYTNWCIGSMNIFFINLDYLKYSNKSIIRYRNKLQRALKFFGQTEEENAFQVSFDISRKE